MSVLSRLFRRNDPPAELLPPLERDERVVSWATAADGSAVVATRLGLWLPAGDGADGPERIGWHLIDKAVWRDGGLTVTPARDTGDGVLAEEPARTVRLTEPRDLPPTVRVRVERSIVFSRMHRLPSGGGVRVVGRRVPGRDGVVWQAVFDRPDDRADEHLRARLAELIAQARAEVTPGA